LLTSDLIEALDATRTQHHPRAAFSEQTRRRLADPAARSRDDHNFALDTAHPRIVGLC
jgi:hypothetical protein